MFPREKLFFARFWPQALDIGLHPLSALQIFSLYESVNQLDTRSRSSLAACCYKMVYFVHMKTRIPISILAGLDVAQLCCRNINALASQGFVSYQNVIANVYKYIYIRNFCQQTDSSSLIELFPIERTCSCLRESILLMTSMRLLKRMRSSSFTSTDKPSIFSILLNDKSATMQQSQHQS